MIKHHRGDISGKFVNVAVLEGDRLKIVDEQTSSLPDCPPLLTSLLGFDAPVSWAASVNVLVQLAVSMRAHGRGGALLVVPSGTDAWRESIVQPISYGIARRFDELADLMRDAPDDPACGRTRWPRAVETIAGLTAVDGATIMTDRYELLAFGAKIARRDGSTADRVGHRDRADRRVGVARRSIPPNSAARAICRPRSSSTISGTPSRSSRHRTATSRSSRGRPVRRWSTRTKSRPCSYR